MPTAILIDGDFFLKRHRFIYGTMKPSEIAQSMHKMCLDHLNWKDDRRELYRIFFYDCPPLSKKAHNPLTKEAIDFSRTHVAAFRLELHNELRKLRKVALRLGYLNEWSGYWAITPEKTKELLDHKISINDLKPEDVHYEVRQKGVDMRIGLDIASMAYKKQVDQIILVAGDSDFVPAAKLARREGIDFILDPMWSHIRDDLFEHIDGLRSVCQKPKRDTIK